MNTGSPKLTNQTFSWSQIKLEEYYPIGELFHSRNKNGQVIGDFLNVSLVDRLSSSSQTSN